MLAMVMAPTSSATAANACSMFFSASNPSVNDSSDSERASSPVTTEMSWPSSAACRFTAASVVGSDAPGARRTASSQAYRSSASGET